MFGIIIAFCVGVLLGLQFSRVRKEMSMRKIHRMESACLLRMMQGRSA